MQGGLPVHIRDMLSLPASIKEEFIIKWVVSKLAIGFQVYLLIKYTNRKMLKGRGKEASLA